MTELGVIALRYGLFAVMLWLAQRGIIEKGQAATITDQIINALPALGAAVIPVWAGIVRYGTRPVPAVTAARDDVPTVNPLTGAKEPAKSSK